MQEVWDAIRIGADSYLVSQLKTILPAMAILMAVALFLSVYVVTPSPRSYRGIWALQCRRLIIAIGRMIAFIVGRNFLADSWSAGACAWRSRPMCGLLLLSRRSFQ